MRERSGMIALVLLALVLGARSLGEPGPVPVRAERPAAAQPNIVLIVADDLGWRDVGFTGSTSYETPFLDRLAGQGMVFTAAYANGPNCAPTRASLMTGQYTPRHGIYTVNSSARGEARHRRLIPTPNRTTLPSEAVTIAEALRAAGYVTASIGKWHLGRPPAHDPTAQGFDVNVGGSHQGHPRSYFSPYGISQLEDGPRGEYLTDRLTAEAVTFIEANRGRPFFLYLSHYAVHTPLQAKQELIEKHRKKAVYAAMIESLDQGVGRVLATLDALGQAENTVVIFTSDNGGHGPTTSMAPLRGAKGMLYEGGIRVPLAVRWPGVVRPGTTSDTPVITVDLFPTLLEVAGAPRPTGVELDGESLVSLLKGSNNLDREALYWHFPAYLEAYRGQVEPGPWRTTPAGAVRSGEWKLIEFFEDGRLELYNLGNDIGERNNLAAAMPDRAAALRRLLVNWRRSVGAPVPAVANPAFRLQP